MALKKSFKRKRAIKAPKKTFKKRKFTKKIVKKKYVPQKKTSGSLMAPQQFGTGHWKSLGHGPRGPKSRSGLVRKLEQILPPQIVINTNTAALPCGAGVQFPGIVASAYTVYDLYNYNGGTAQATTFIGQNKVILKDYSLNINFTNQSNANIKVMLYDFIARRDMYNSGGEVALNPLVAWNNESSLCAGYNNAQYGATPFDSQLLCKTWKCIGSQEYRLSEGETGEHRVHSVMNKIHDHTLDQLTTSTATIGNLSAQAGALKGLTYFCLAVVSGSPTDANNSTVTSSIGKVDFVSVNRYTWEQIIAQQQVATTNVTMGTVAGQVFNQGSGASVAIANI